MLIRIHPLLFIFIVCLGCRSNSGNTTHSEVQSGTQLDQTKIPSGTLPNLMVPDSRLMPMVSAHRGGRNIPEYPENSLEVFAYTLQHTPAMLECDVNITSDGQLILMHDNSLERTTNGSGIVQQTDWRTISKLKLVDDFGTITPFSVPTFEETLVFAKHRAILSVDVKRNVPFDAVVKAIEDADMIDYVVVITYNVADAETVHELNNDLMISVSIRNQEEWSRMKNSKVPTNRMVAFTGTRLSTKALFDTLHHYDIPAILGTLGNLDKRVEARNDSLYLDYLRLGANILATDRPIEAGEVLAKERNR